MSKIETLTSSLLSEPKRSELTVALTQLIHDEVQSKKGVSGFAIKAGFKALQTIDARIVSRLIDGLLPEFIRGLVPLLEERSSTNDTLKDFFVSNSTKVADALPHVTDTRADKSSLKVAVRAYKKLRPMASTQVQAALPRLAAVLQRFDVS